MDPQQILRKLNSRLESDIQQAFPDLSKNIPNFPLPFWKQAIIRLVDIAKSSTFSPNIRGQCLDLLIDQWENGDSSKWDNACKIAFTEALVVLLKKKSAAIGKMESDIVMYIKELEIHQFDSELGKLVMSTAHPLLGGTAQMPLLGEDAQVNVLEHLSAAPSSTFKQYFATILQNPNYGPRVYFIAAKSLKEHFAEKPEQELYQRLMPLWNQFLSRQDYVRIEQCAQGFGDFPPPDVAIARQLLTQLVPLEQKLRVITQLSNAPQCYQAVRTLLQIYYAIDKIVHDHRSALANDNCLAAFRQLNVKNLQASWEAATAKDRIYIHDDGIMYLAEIFVAIQPNQPTPTQIHPDTITDYLNAIERNLPPNATQFKYAGYAAGQMATCALGILFLVGWVRRNPGQKLKKLPLLQNLVAYLKTNPCTTKPDYYAYAFAFTSLAISQSETLFPAGELAISRVMQDDWQTGLYKSLGPSGYSGYEKLLTHQLAVVTITLLYIKRPIYPSNHKAQIEFALEKLRECVVLKEPLKIRYVSGREIQSPIASAARAVLVHLALWLASPKDAERQKILTEALALYVDAGTTCLLETAVNELYGTHAGIYQLSSYYYYTSIPYAASGIKLLLKQSTLPITLSNKLLEIADLIYSSLLRLTTPGIAIKNVTHLPFIGEKMGSAEALVFSNLMAGIALLALQDVFVLCPEPA